MAKRGRPSIYDEAVKPYLKEIKKWAETGATLQEIADALGIAKSTLCDYKNKYSELSNAIKKSRKIAVLEIKASLFKKAKGYDYKESEKHIKKSSKGEEVTFVKETTKHQPPSEAAANMLLKNWDKTWKQNDVFTNDLKEQELKLREIQINNNNNNWEEE